MKKLFAAALILMALLLGLLLPSASMGLLDEQTEQDEAAALQQVDLSASSGLNLVEKLRLLCDEESEILDVGVGWNQTAMTLSSSCWYFLSNYQDADFPLLYGETARQESQTALLVSSAGGDSAFLVWEVFFDDEGGNRLYLYVDDETGNILGMHHWPVESMGDEEVWSFAALTGLVEYLTESGELTLVDPGEGYEAYYDYLGELFRYYNYQPKDNTAVTGSYGDYRPTYDGEVPSITLRNDTGDVCMLTVDYGEAWFRININR